MMDDKRNFSGIKQWAVDDRPREKMLLKGAEALSDAELIAILFQNGTKEMSAVDLARSLLQSIDNSLDALSRFNIKDFQKTKGIGIAKSCKLMAALELGRRKQFTQAINRNVFTSSESAADFFNPILRDKSQECFVVVYLNQASKLIHWEQLHAGGISATIIDVRLVLRTALNHYATNIIVAHNHPSGSIKPSQADIQITEKLKNAAQIMDIRLLDHLIIGGDRYYSFADEGLL